MGYVKLWTREEIIAANFGGLLLITEGDHVREVDAYRETIARLEYNAKDAADMIGRMGSDLVANRKTIAKLEQRLGDMQDQSDRIAETGRGP